MTYHAVRALAQAYANETGRDAGVEKTSDGYRWFSLPARQFRFGHELRCEVVMCEDLAKCRPGHGPVTCSRCDGTKVVRDRDGFEYTCPDCKE